LSGITLPRAVDLDALVLELGGELDAAARGVSIERVTSPRDASRAADLVVLTAPRWLEIAAAAPGICLLGPELAARLPAGRRFRHSHPMWLVARLLEPVARARSAERSAAPAHVERGAEVAADATLGAGAVILAGARIGAGAAIEPNAVIYGAVTLGARVVVGAGAVVGRPGFGWTPGPDGRLVRVPQLGGVIVEDDVEIGALCTIDAGTLGPTVLRRGTKLDAHVHVGHNVEIGEASLVAAQAGFAGSAVLGSGVLVGGQAGVTDHARIGDHARIAAKSGVIGDIPAAAVVAGFPAVPRMRWLRAMATALRDSTRKPPR